MFEASWTGKEVVTLIVAAIGFISALTSALLAYRTARRVAEIGRRNELEVATVKRYLDGYFDLRMQGFDKEVQAYREFLGHLQVFRDKVRAVARSPHSYGTAALRKEIDELVLPLQQCYAQSQMSFADTDRVAIHSAKVRCVRLAEKLVADFDHTHADPLPAAAEILAGEKEIAVAQSDLLLRGKQAIGRLMTELEAHLPQPLR